MPWATSGPSMTFTVFERVSEWKKEMELWNRVYEVKEMELWNRVVEVHEMQLFNREVNEMEHEWDWTL